MPPSTVNLLWLSADGTPAVDEVSAAATTLRQRAEGKDDAFFARRGFVGAADFLARYQRLSGVVLRLPGSIALWLNPIARHKLRPDIATALTRLTLTLGAMLRFAARQCHGHRAAAVSANSTAHSRRKSYCLCFSGWEYASISVPCCVRECIWR